MRKLIEKEYDNILKLRDRGNLACQHKAELVPFLEFLVQYFKNEGCINFLEIGLHVGDHFTLVGNIFVKLDKTTTGIGLDLPNQGKWGGHTKDPKKSIQKLQPQFPYNIIIGNSQKPESLGKVKTLLNGNKINFLYIDGDHSYKGCTSDFNMYKELVVPGGLIVLHDIKKFDSKPHIEVHKFWKELKTQYKWHEFSEVKDAGIGVIEV